MRADAFAVKPNHRRAIVVSRLFLDKIAAMRDLRHHRPGLTEQSNRYSRALGAIIAHQYQAGTTASG